MPLRLLQHKSWHVYSTDNVERVRRDEEKEQLRLEGAEQDRLALSAQGRLELLRVASHGGSKSLACDISPPQQICKPEAIHAEDSFAQKLDRKERNDERGHPKARSHRDCNQSDTSRAVTHKRHDPDRGSRMRLKPDIEKRDDNTFRRLDHTPWYTTKSAASSSVDPILSPSTSAISELQKKTLDPLENMRVLLDQSKAKKRKNAAPCPGPGDDMRALSELDRYGPRTGQKKQATRIWQRDA